MKLPWKSQHCTTFACKSRIWILRYLLQHILLLQAGALVHVCTNGTVLVTHGGVEMGQGFAYKGCVIPLSSVFVSETSTYKVPNASPTAASASSDMYGAAVLDAVE
ncbi:Aldehyde oxidase/xanthine dehydrogenase molybdopterin binding [Arabidopsis suecica]|nr:Aldehyde oxidase/xanthine dehydrogenase molybdopterin binding [Arabidopsis suecica]